MYAAARRREYLGAVATQFVVFTLLLVFAAVLAAKARNWRNRDLFFVERGRA
jgi:hypothetical protein